MKLKTELTKEQPFGRHVRWKETGDLYHDAAMAHALVMAMEEFRPKVGYAMWEFAIPMITNRADELMREWGYTED